MNNGCPQFFPSAARVGFLHLKHDDVSVEQLDRLVGDGIIIDIDRNISEPQNIGTEIIDHSNLITSPGLIDNHWHRWRTQLKDRHSDELFFDYVLTGNLTRFFDEPLDVTLDELSAVLESTYTGTTTIVDHRYASYLLSQSCNCWVGRIGSFRR